MIMSEAVRQIECPTCKKPAKWDPENPYRPFCSERCKLIDFGAWADGSYGIPEEAPDNSIDSGVE